MDQGLMHILALLKWSPMTPSLTAARLKSSPPLSGSGVWFSVYNEETSVKRMLRPLITNDLLASFRKIAFRQWPGGYAHIGDLDYTLADKNPRIVPR